MDSTHPTPKAPEEKKFWFRAKTYGYGWYPATWQGWGLVMLYLIFVLYGAWDILSGASSGLAGVKRFVLTTLVLTFFLLYFAYTHGEKLSWRWGKSDTKHDDRTQI